jgi:hypothetical protein
LTVECKKNLMFTSGHLQLQLVPRHCGKAVAVQLRDISKFNFIFAGLT